MTEEEIVNGLLNSSDVGEACFWFKRTIHDIKSNITDKNARRYIDMISDQVDAEAQNLLEVLK